MASLIRVGEPVNGRTRRFSRLTKDRFLYSCPTCTSLVSNDEAYCVCGEDLRTVSDLYGKEGR